MYILGAKVGRSEITVMFVIVFFVHSLLMEWPLASLLKGICQYLKVSVGECIIKYACVCVEEKKSRK